MVKPSGRDNYMYPKNRVMKYMKQTLTRTERRNRHLDSKGWRLQRPTFNNGQNNEAEDQQGNRRHGQHKPLDPSDSHTAPPPATAKHTFISCAHETFCRGFQIWGHKTNLNTCKRNEIIPHTFSNHDGMKFEISNRRFLWGGAMKMFYN